MMMIYLLNIIIKIMLDKMNVDTGNYNKINLLNNKFILYFKIYITKSILNKN